jgi:hypothetical protein
MVQPPNAQADVPLGLEMPPADWQQTPSSVQTLVLTLLKRLEAVEARLTQDSTTSQRPPSTDSPYKKARKSTGDAPGAKRVGNPAILVINRPFESQPRPGCSHRNNARVAIPP